MQNIQCGQFRRHNFLFRSSGTFIGIYQPGRFLNFEEEEHETSSWALALKIIELIEQRSFVLPEKDLQEAEACLIALYRLRFLNDQLLEGCRDFINALKFYCRFDAIAFPTFSETFQ